jgi:hypothetical protein
MSNDDLFNRKQAAAYLRKMGCAASPSTLANMAVSGNAGGGPPFIVYRNRKRRHVSYRRVDLDEWAAKKIRRVE